ncbi:MAG: hypothetical protein GKC10_09910 [Methanosarcinales archaeon]|nr:hypothetical protein [Methanosarcinales archaeon]
MRGKLLFFGEKVEDLARALEPDNLEGMTMKVDQGCLTIEYRARKMGTLLSTTDDILMNIKIAEEALASSEDV